MSSFNQALGHCFTDKKENIQKSIFGVVIVSEARVFPSIYNLAKKEYLISSVQNSLVPLFTSRKHISNVYEGKIFHG